MARRRVFKIQVGCMHCQQKTKKCSSSIVEIFINVLFWKSALRSFIQLLIHFQKVNKLFGTKRSTFWSENKFFNSFFCLLSRF